MSTTPHHSRTQVRGKRYFTDFVTMPDTFYITTPIYYVNDPIPVALRAPVRGRQELMT